MVPLAEFRGRVGMVMPIWFPPAYPRERMVAILRGSLADVETFFAQGHAVAVVDGAPHVEPAVEQVWKEFHCGNRSPFEILKSEVNRGKGGAVAQGLAQLLGHEELEAFVIRDDDGDHFLNDAPSLYALLRQMAEETGSDLLLVNGRRSDLHWPLGFVRGQYELLLDEVVWSALEYSAARKGRAVARNYFGRFGRVPDFKSGYKMYGRGAARLVVEASEAVATSEPAMLRWGCEILPVVEVIEAGGWLGEVIRKALASQPLSTYAYGADWQAIHVAMLRWTFLRLDIPAEVAVCLFDNALSTLPFLQHPQGFQEMMALREAVMTATYPGAPLPPWRRPALL